MKELKILHLYSDLLDLYGDYTNVTAVRRAAAQLGYESAVTEVQLGQPIDPTGYDFVYIGHGKARNLAAAAPHFRQYAEAIAQAVENETVFLVTGNARFLFGGSFQTPDSEEEGIGLFPYHGIETGKVFTSDVVSSPVFDESVRCYGFINRTAHLTGENPYPLFRVLRGPGDGETPTGTEGTLYKNFFGTWQMGPVLVRNPALLREVLHRITGEDCSGLDLGLQERALAITLAEFGNLQ